jgi:hypothetical protein
MEPRTRNNPISPRNGKIPVEGFFFRLDGPFLTGVFLVPALLVGLFGIGDLLIF